jgi:ABC-type branched-subunit amino acid transport system substrate-binding protein
MTALPDDLRRAIDLARNHHLIEEDEIYVQEDGRQFFERRLKEVINTHPDGVLLIAQIPSFSTTCWKIPHPQAQQGKITWPWALR